MSASATSEAGGSQKIAIISANCRFPGSNSVEEFWATLQNRENNFKTQSDRYYVGLENEVNFLKCPVDQFDAEFFNISPNKAVLLDPQQRLLMELTWEALENACINPHNLRGSATGIFIGAWSIDYEKIIAKSSLAGSQEFHVGYISSSYGALSSHIAYFLGLKAKHATIDRGPASSLFTLAKACTSLERGECNLAVAAAVNLILFPRLGQAEKNSNCRKSSEGCGVVILKRLSDAIADKDFILGVIDSIGICTDAADGKFGTLSQKSIEKAISNSHLISEIDTKEISYVEVQGNESIERQAIESVYGRMANIIFDCAADSIGNAESAAGFASLIKILLCFEHKIIPAVPPKVWNKSNTKRYAAINSYGFANECAHLILEEPPDAPNVCSLEIGKICYNILALSANSSDALEKLLERYKILFASKEYKISDICFTANTCRAQLNYRVAMYWNNKDDILSLLHNRKFLSGTGGKPKIAFLFNSHNSFRFNLLSKQFYESNFHFKDSLDRCSEIFQKYADCKYSLIELLWQENTLEEERQKYLLAINFCVQYSVTELFKSFGISPDFVLGYSTGEFSAGCVSGLLNLSDTLNFLILVCQENYSGQKLTVLSIATSKLIADKLLSFFLEENLDVHQSGLKIFAVNSEDQVIIVSKSEETSNKFVQLCLEESIEAKIINAQSSLHFSQRSPNSLDCLLKAMTNCKSSTSSFVSGCTGSILTGTDIHYWKDVFTKVVSFSDGFKALWLQGCRIFIEVGNADLLRLAKLNISQIQAASCVWGSSLNSHEDNLSNLASLLSKLFVSGCNIHWEVWYQNSSRSKVQIPTYPFQRQRFWPISN